LELEKAAEHGAQRGVKIKKPWDSAGGYVSAGTQLKSGSDFNQR
jgi:hypothetical protein